MMSLNSEEEFNYFSEKFHDIQVLRYRIQGFENLSLREKTQLYYLSEAAYSGRDIIYDQNYRHGLLIRKVIELLVLSFRGDRKNQNFQNFLAYAKRMFFSNGIFHHYSTKKFIPDFDESYLKELMINSDQEALGAIYGNRTELLYGTMRTILFNPDIDKQRVCLDQGEDLVLSSANNYYQNLSQKEAEDFYAQTKDADQHVSQGLNSTLIKSGGKVREEIWKSGGKYGPAIDRIIFWLGKALELSDTEAQRESLRLLIEFYRTGNLKTFDLYCIAWAADTESSTDTVNGFIEVYGDPLGYKGSYESVVSFKNIEGTRRSQSIANNAEYFEQASPIMDCHKRSAVKGVSAKVITVTALSGDASPSTPIGINLPNSEWIREKYGSKSVNLGNIVEAHNILSQKNGIIEEFAYSAEEIARAKSYGIIASNLHTDMHEIIGHGSGIIEPGKGTPKETLKNYYSTLEEARADLVALYFLMDSKLEELGLVSSAEVAKAGYDAYIRGGLLIQLARIKKGDSLEESHMRNRQAVASWVLEAGHNENVIEKKRKGSKTYFVINNYERLRKLFGEMLKEVQRIKSQGDYQAGRNLIETYGVKVNEPLREEVSERYLKLGIAPYSGFINPKLRPVEKDGKITDIKVEYPESFLEQMLSYSKEYSFLNMYR